MASRVAPDLGGVLVDGVTPVPRDRRAADDGDRVQAEEHVEEAVRRETRPRRRRHGSRLVVIFERGSAGARTVHLLEYPWVSMLGVQSCHVD